MPPRKNAPPPGNTGTHQPPPNAYFISQINRTNYVTARRNPFTETPDALATQLQRLVHHQGNRPPNRKILFQLRLLTYYPPVPDILEDLIALLDSRNAHICRLAHYHIRSLAPIRDAQLHRSLLDALERQAASPSPARRACATKTYAKVFQQSDVQYATDFVLGVFNKIGGARVARPQAPDSSHKSILPSSKVKQEKPPPKKPLSNIAKKMSINRSIVRGPVYKDPEESNKSKHSKMERRNSRAMKDDGVGGTIQGSYEAATKPIFSRNGKMVVCHSALAALRHINRVATDDALVESYIFDSGLMSIVPSAVRHTMALLELRCGVSPTPVSRYLVNRLPHRNPPAHISLQLEDLGARVFFARILSSLAEDPNLSVHIPDEAPKQAKRNKGNENTLKGALGAATYTEKANKLFKFLFNRERVANVVDSVVSTTQAVSAQVRKPRVKRDDSLGVEYAEALVNLVRNVSNRVLIEALRGLSKRRWTTWFEAPVPKSALYNAPELDGETFAGGDGLWDDDDDDDSARPGDSDDEDELGAYEEDMAGEEGEPGKRDSAAADPELAQPVDSDEKDTWVSRLRDRRKERREERIHTNKPFYLRQEFQGSVPALEVILRRINVGLLSDEPVRRFAAVDAVVVLARAKIYGDSKEEQEQRKKAISIASSSKAWGASSRALVTATPEEDFSVSDEQHPFQGLVRPLAELVEEDLNAYVRGRAAVALLFVIAAGAGRNITASDDIDVSEEALERAARLRDTPLLLRFFRSYVRSARVGSGIGLRLMSELVDYLLYEVLDAEPELCPSAVAMAEEWALVHPTVGVCGRLGALWEKVLSLGQGGVVGGSLLRAMNLEPRHERVASAAVIFLRRRALDVAVLTAGASHVAGGSCLPEPLPRAVGIEMEKYFSVLWHTALVGPSAECRTFAVESLGGAAVLAGEPFRICTYERLVEVVKMGGFGLRVPAERVLDCLDTLYSCRERFSEERARSGAARDGRERSKTWLEFVWKLRCEAFAAAQIALGVRPPVGWLALGPGGAADVANAERVFGEVSDAGPAREGDVDAFMSDGNAKDADQGANAEEGAQEDAQETAATDPGEGGRGTAGLSLFGGLFGGGRAQERDGRNEARGNGSGSGSASRSRRSSAADERERNRRERAARADVDERDRRDYDDRYFDDYNDYDDYDYARKGHDERPSHHGEYEEDGDWRWRTEDGADENGSRRRRSSAARNQGRADWEPGVAESGTSRNDAGQRGTVANAAETARDVLTSASGVAERLVRQGVRGGKEWSDKMMKSAARSAVMDKLRGGGKRE